MQTQRSLNIAAGQKERGLEQMWPRNRKKWKKLLKQLHYQWEKCGQSSKEIVRNFIVEKAFVHLISK